MNLGCNIITLLSAHYCPQNFTSLLAINTLESTFFSDCSHTTNNDGVCIDWPLHLEDSSNLSDNN